MTWFTKKDFYLIMGLRCDEPYNIEVEHFDIRLLIKYFPEKFCFLGESNNRRRAKGKVK